MFMILSPMFHLSSSISLIHPAFARGGMLEITSSAEFRFISRDLFVDCRDVFVCTFLTQLPSSSRIHLAATRTDEFPQRIHTADLASSRARCRLICPMMHDVLRP
jgi:hypothetical protein